MPPDLKTLFSSDIDYEAEIARLMGPYGQRAIDPSVVTFLPNPPVDQGIHGFFSRGAGRAPEPFASALAAGGRGPELEADELFLVGDRGIKGIVSAHEFRHRAVPQMGEDVNRLWDLWRADSPEEYQRAAKFMFPSSTPEQAMQQADQIIEKAREDLLSAEASSMVRTGQTAPKRGLLARLLHPYTSDERAFVESQAEIRGRRTHPEPDDGPGLAEALKDPEFWVRDLGSHARRVLLDPLKVASRRFQAITDPRADAESRREATKAVFDQLGPAGITKIGRGAVRVARDPEIGLDLWDMAIKATDGTQIGEILGYIRHIGDRPTMQVTESFVSKGERGAGLGRRAYQQAADEAHAAGLDFASDTVVSESAARVYDSLASRGYQVRKNPSAELIEGSWESGNGAPIFTVLPRSQ